MTEPILWEGNVRALGLQQRVQVARRLGYRKMSLSPNTLGQWEAQGLSLDQIHDICGEVQLAHLDPLVRWNRGHRDEDLTPQLREFSTTSQSEFFECAQRLGVESITLPAIVSAHQATMEDLANDFADVCDRARPFGIRCDLEFLPYWSGVPTLQMAMSIVEHAGRDNGSVLFDIYHFMRGGGSAVDILQVDGRLISAIQISDGAGSLSVDTDPIHDMLNARLLPGLGQFPLQEVLANLEAIGAGEVIGVEVFSTALDELDVHDLAAALGTASHNYVERFLKVN
ncbi:MAG: sugar phosphate isomerase/epimerase family protein [Nocardioides sp.]